MQGSWSGKNGYSSLDLVLRGFPLGVRGDAVAMEVLEEYTLARLADPYTARAL